MNKLLTALLAAFLGAGLAQAATTSGSGSLSGSSSLSGSASTNTNNNTALSTNNNVNTNTNTNSVNVYGPGSNKLARQQPSSGTNVSMMPHGGSKPSGSTAGTVGSTTTAQNGSKSCPPGLAKKDNGCMPPGIAKRDRDDTRMMGNTGGDDHRVASRHHRTRHHRHHAS